MCFRFDLYNINLDNLYNSNYSSNVKYFLFIYVHVDEYNYCVTKQLAQSNLNGYQQTFSFLLHLLRTESW